jgi:hypothetical protein
MAFAPVVRWLELWRYAVLHGIGWVSTFFSANFAKNCDKNCAKAEWVGLKAMMMAGAGEMRRKARVS